MFTMPDIRRSLATCIIVATACLATEQTFQPTTTTPPPTAHPNVKNIGPITTPSDTPSQCEARTINYITHTLPQSCLTSSWASADAADNDVATDGTALSEAGDDASRTSEPASEQTAPSTIQDNIENIATDEDEASATPFMSFEDWKELMLRNSGQDPQELRQRKATDGAQQDDHYKYQVEPGLDSFGEEGEISLNFGGYSNQEDTNAASHGGKDNDRDDEATHYEVGKPAVHRSKDAGKTCKERFSFASFDAGATILKTSTGAKNSKAILVENKDSYMLLECATKNKYVIVELTDDIWVDTIVLANFEFFSSMVRHFRVSVSDRYPVKMEKWKEVGIFEARNSRDIQAFLVDNPQIWAKYVRVEFLTHYGNEYYCPVSLIRVHGSRMLDKWKDSETADDDAIGEIEGHDESSDSTVSSDHVEGATRESNVGQHLNVTSARSATHPFHIFGITCPTDKELITSLPNNTASQEDSALSEKPCALAESKEVTLSATPYSEAFETQVTVVPISNSVNESDGSREERANNTTTSATGNAKAATIEQLSQAAPATNKTSVTGSASSKVRSAGPNSASAGAAPTMQEGFFNSMTKRLQQVESNLTLSLKYVEEQSKHIQEAFQKSEQKQLLKISSVLTSLNDTVLAELRTFRDQYDQIWQSTVLALESQKDQSQRDILALSSRLNVLADEVVFQKRMAILQAVLLCSCLCLVIFARGGPIPYLASTPDQSMSTSAAFAEILASMQRRDMYPGSSPTRRLRESAVGQNSPSDKIDDSPGRLMETSPRASFDDYGYQRPSPPLTPNNEPNDTSSEWQSAGHATAIQTNSQIESQHVQGRKPLPALPENPASPGTA
ncbi:transcription factor TFIIIC subunit tfc4 [Lecanicillium sp. MT-2017a]|nr:transcription factor TFIIIC subunit tfc4 [Lecanicillium sp. MT-2017a]